MYPWVIRNASVPLLFVGTGKPLQLVQLKRSCLRVGVWGFCVAYSLVLFAPLLSLCQERLSFFRHGERFTLAITPESKSVLMYSMREAQRFIRGWRQRTLCSSFLEGDGGVEGLFCVFLEAEKLLVWQRWCLYTFLRPHIGWAWGKWMLCVCVRR